MFDEADKTPRFTIKLLPNFTLEVGLGYDWNGPSEALNRFVVFDPVTSSLVQVGRGLDQVYEIASARLTVPASPPVIPEAHGRCSSLCSVCSSSKEPSSP